MKSFRERTFIRRVASSAAWPFGLLYSMGVRLKNAAYDSGKLKPRHLSWPVVSVGNLSVGGTGKTPVVILLAKLLETRGWAVDALSRGYGRSDRDIVRVDPKGEAEVFGDEPLMMARRGIAVYVGPDRYRAGMLAEQDEKTAPNYASRLHILDDGFQHRKLRRAVDIVLLQRRDFEDRILPGGRLREHLDSLRRADICVLRAEDADLKDRVLRLMGQTDTDRVWITERRMVLPPLAVSDAVRNALAFCAIGDPRGFFQGIRQAGINVVEEISFRDHHVYTREDVEQLKTAARRSGAQCFVTTEKDGVRLAARQRVDLETECPLIIVGLEVSLCEEARSISMLESLLAMRLQRGQRDVR